MQHLSTVTGKWETCNAKKRPCRYIKTSIHREEDATQKEELWAAVKKQVASVAKKHSKPGVSPIQSNSVLEMGRLGEDGFLAEDEVDRIQIHGMSCPECGSALGARNLFAEEDGGAVCDQDHVTFIDDLHVNMTPENPSYRYLSKDAVLAEVWYHSSQDSNWLKSFEDDEEATVHLGVEQASYDRALYDYASKKVPDDFAHDFYLYEVRIDGDASVADNISNSNYTVDREIERKWIDGEKADDVTRYYNTVEGPGSISLVANPRKLKIIGKRKVSKDDARQILSIQNVRSADRRKQPSWD